MNGRNGRLMMALGQINEKYIRGSERNMGIRGIIKVAVSLAALIAIGLTLFLPYAPVTSDISAYSGSDYFPLIEGIEEYRLTFKQPKYKNNFEALVNSILTFGAVFGPSADMGGSAPDLNEGAESDMDGNGSYLEATDNQVEGVIESDLFKMTDKYIFRLGYQLESKEFESEKGTYVQQIPVPILNVYSINKEYSELVGLYKIPTFEGEYFKDYNSGEMFLSLDGNTVTIIKNYTDEQSNKGKVGIISLDVSDIRNISTKAMVSIDGSLNTSRMVDGKLLLVTEYYVNQNSIDYNDPATFVPTIDSGKGAEPIEFEDIIFPKTVGNTRYSVVALFDAESLQLMGANALLNFTENVYISENNVYITREYNERIDGEDGGYQTSNKSDIAVLDYSGERLEKKGVITARGWTEDQYSFDEKDGYLRIVTSTTDGIYTVNGPSGNFRNIRNASLYIFNLADNSLAYSVEDFAPEGEEATAVRFDGDKCYVCTAVVVTFTDPVYFFDLSDYENITFTDTGIIEGYSDHLINFGEGFTLGIGREDWEYNKVEIYEQQGDSVVSVDEFKFMGRYSTEYKAYLVDRENNLFGFGVNGYYEEGSTFNGANVYILLQFNGYELKAYTFNISLTADSVRAAYIDGYLYVTTDTDLTVEKIN